MSPVSGALFEEGAFADVIKSGIWRWDHPRLSEWILNLRMSVLLRDTKRRDMWRGTEGHGKMEVETGRMSLQPKNASGHQKLEERRKDSPLGPSEGALVPAQSCERTHFCCWKPPKTVEICYSTPRKLTHLTSFSWTNDILMIQKTKSYDYQTHKFEISEIYFTLQLIIALRLIN